MSHVTSTGVVFSPLAARFFPGRGVLPFEEITAVRRAGRRVLLTLIDGGRRSLRTRSASEAEALDAAVAKALHVSDAELDAVVSVASLCDATGSSMSSAPSRPARGGRSSTASRSWRASRRSAVMSPKRDASSSNAAIESSAHG